MARSSQSASASTGAYRTRNVFVVSIDGLRSTEAFGAPDPGVFIPNMNRLRGEGSLYRNVYNLGGTWTTPGNYSIVDGCLELTAPSHFYYRHFRPRSPTIFEYYRRANPAVPKEKVWAVSGARDCEIIGFSSNPLYGEDYEASVYRPNAYMPDDLTWAALQEKMDAYHPSLVFLQLYGINQKAEYNFQEYLRGIKKADEVVGALWDKIQSDDQYRDQTTLLVTASQGRHDEEHGGFKRFGDICEGCKHVFLLALGPDIQAGAEFSEFRQLTDICPTVGELLGFDTPLCEGQVLHEMIVGYEPHSTPLPAARPQSISWQDETQLTSSPGLVEQPRIAVNRLGLHVVWVDSRSGQREIYYKTRSAGGWSQDLQLSSSGSEARAPAIAVDGDTVHVVWQDYQPGNWAIYYRQRSADGAWSQPELAVESLLEGDRTSQMVWEPAVTARQGQVLVAVPMARHWLRVYRRVASGEWSSPATLIDSSQRPNPDDRWALPQGLSMSSSDSSSYLVWQEVQNISWKLGYAKSDGDANVWMKEPSVPLPTNFMGGNDGSVAASGNDVYAAWIILYQLSWEVDPQYHYLARNQSSNAGLAWEQGNGTAIVSHGCRNTDLAAAPGMAALVWEDYRDGLPVIYLSRSTDNGASWHEQPVSYGSDFSIEPSVATDGEKVYVVWRDRRDGSWQLYLGQVSDVEPSPTPSPTLTASPASTATPTATPTPTMTATTVPTATPTATGTMSSHKCYLPILLHALHP